MNEWSPRGRDYRVSKGAICEIVVSSWKLAMGSRKVGVRRAGGERGGGETCEGVSRFQGKVWERERERGTREN
jgi:hypothetical protein